MWSSSNATWMSLLDMGLDTLYTRCVFHLIVSMFDQVECEDCG